MHFPVPAPGDIVWCRVPEIAPLRPEPTPRPARVISVMDNVNPPRASPACRTRRTLTPLRRGECAVRRDDAAAFSRSGLSRPGTPGLRSRVVPDCTGTWIAPASTAPYPLAATPRPVRCLLCPCPSGSARDGG